MKSHMKKYRKITILKKNKKHKKINIIITSFILIIIIITLIFKIINKAVTPVLIDYAEVESRKIASVIINKAVAKHTTTDLKIDELFIITRNDDGQVMSIDLNPIIVNKTLTQTTSSVQLNLKYLEQGNLELLELPQDILVSYDKKKLKKGIIFEIPSGVILKNNILNNLGPKIPVKLSLVGDVLSGISTKVTNYGINNALIEVFIDLEMTEQVILPFTSDKIKIKTSVPLALKIIQGTVPDLYLGSLNNNQNLKNN